MNYIYQIATLGNGYYVWVGSSLWRDMVADDVIIFEILDDSGRFGLLKKELTLDTGTGVEN